MEHPGGYPVLELAAASLRDTFELADRIPDLREVVEDRVAGFQLDPTVVEHLSGMTFVSTNHDDEVAVAVERSPERGGLDHARLAGTARHGEGEQLTAQNRGLDLRDDPQVIGRPGHREGCRQVRLREQPEVVLGIGAAFGVDDRRDLADLPTGSGDPSSDGILPGLPEVVADGLPLVDGRGRRLLASAHRRLPYLFIIAADR